MKAKDYYGSHMTVYEKPESLAWQSINVLEFLNGKKWDEVALAYVHALQPSSIRVTTGMIKLDARTWRVTVYIDNEEDSIIDYISQEVEVGLPDKVVHGEALGWALEYGIESPECQWHNDDRIRGYFHNGITGEYFKQLEGAPMEAFPTRDGEHDEKD